MHPRPVPASVTMSGVSAQLDYAPTPRRRIRARWVGLAALLIAAILLVRYGKDIAAQAKLRRIVYRCTTYTRPTDSIALEANAADAARLVAQDSAYRLF